MVGWWKILAPLMLAAMVHQPTIHFENFSNYELKKCNEKEHFP
jgi:hypothetical protein